MLKAQRSPQEASIRCWDCHTEVKVPRFRDSNVPREKSRFLEILENWGDLVSGTVLLALLTLVAIAIPRVGGLLALAVLTLGGALYIKRIEEVGLDDTEHHDPLLPLRSGRAARVRHVFGRLLLGLILVVGLSFPFWAGEGAAVGFSRPHIPVDYLLMFLAPILWIGLPMVVFGLTARRLSGRGGTRKVLLAILKRPWTTLAALLILPLTFLVMEVLLLGLLVSTGWLSAFVFDMFPSEVHINLTKYETIILPNGMYAYTPKGYAQIYNDSLQTGFTLVGSIPLSLSRGLSPVASIEYFSTLTNERYLIIRIVISLVELTLILAILVVQASLLGQVARWVVPAPPPPSPVDELKS